jgi:hypothetical protein
MTNDKIVECVECQEKDFERFMKKNEAGEVFCPAHFIPESAPDVVDYHLSNRDR